MTDAPKRRGRPPSANIAKVQIEHSDPVRSAEAAPRAAVAPSKRRPRAAVGGFGTKLSAPARPGYQRRFVNDTGNRIAEMEALGYTLVEEPGVQSFDPGSRINRLAGTKDGGAPLKTYLMETPIELYQQGRNEMEEENAVVDRAIVTGKDSAGGLSDRETYSPRGHESSIQIER
jgi:hypothetical protein